MSIGGTAGPGRLRVGQAVLYGGLAVGVLDILDALVFFGLRGVAPIRIFQSIASGLLGRAAYDGGLDTAVLGAVLHFFIATSIATVYVLASRKVDVLARRPVVCGLAYGVLVYFFMNQVVLPLSAFPSRGGAPPLPVLLNGIVGHALLVGLPPAWFASRAVPAAGGAS
jgi:hypothetical protein